MHVEHLSNDRHRTASGCVISDRKTGNLKRETITISDENVTL